MDNDNKNSAASPAAPAYKMVPVEPTDDMKDAPEVEVGGCYSCSATKVSWRECAEIYRAMLAAAPAAPVEPVITAPRVEDSAKDHAVQQAQIWAQEARGQRATVLSILRYFGLPERDWEALSLITAHLARQAQPTDRDAVCTAAEAVVRDALDNADVHPCDYHSDEARAMQLLPLMQSLYCALKGKSGSGSPAADGWISVDERLPKEKTRALVAYESDAEGVPCLDVGYARLDNNGWKQAATFYDMTGARDGRPFVMRETANVKVTHWMPLPEAPGKSGSVSEGAADAS